MPLHPDRIAIDCGEDGKLIDPELLRIQMQRSPSASTAITIRLPDGRLARSLQVNTGTDESAVGLGVVHFPEQTPNPAEQVEQLRELASVCDIVSKAILSLNVSVDESEEGSSFSVDSGFVSARFRFREFHRSLDLKETAMSIASESAWLADCDRVSVLLIMGSRLRLQAVTGVDVIDRRGNESRYLEEFAERAIAVQKPFVYPSLDEVPPQIESSLNAYMDQSLIQSGVLVPLQDSPTDNGLRPGAVVGALLFERFRGEPLRAVSPAMQMVCDEALIAINNAQSHQSIFLLPLWKAVHRLTSPWVRYKTIFAATVASGLFIASLLIEVDYRVTATGMVEPRTVRNVFASTDGVVTRLHVADGDFVRKGDLLVEIDNAELQRQAEEIAGEIHTAIEKLASVESVLVTNDRARRDSNDGDQMSIERHQLQSQLEGLYAQQVIITAEKERQSIRSTIDGHVIGWRLTQRMEQRPVSRGHRLFSVVDIDGPKVLRLQVADHDSGAVLEHDAVKMPLQVDFILATQPDRTLKAEVVEIASATHLNAEGLNQLALLANVTPDQEIAANMGAEVTAAIHCGRRSILATWFGDVSRFYHRHIRFYFG